ncbi:hypothetical protein KKH23_08360 [Patescibacteria group bacterium]|uniref:Uncharacterized protein n=1 Tax=viral metagenome TaxID=1070528 RepID=A0A6M3MCZ0_9ZZZZ|nr:hypothetical protein [Patescibacteria group bacterium]
MEMEIGLDTKYQTTLKATQKQLANALEKALASFPEWQSPQARVDLANYVLGYLGVSWGLKFGK